MTTRIGIGASGDDEKEDEKAAVEQEEPEEEGKVNMDLLCPCPGPGASSYLIEMCPPRPKSNPGEIDDDTITTRTRTDPDCKSGLGGTSGVFLSNEAKSKIINQHGGEKEFRQCPFLLLHHTNANISEFLGLQEEESEKLDDTILFLVENIRDGSRGVWPTAMLEKLVRIIVHLANQDHSASTKGIFKERETFVVSTLLQGFIKETRCSSVFRYYCLFYNLMRNYDGMKLTLGRRVEFVKTLQRDFEQSLKGSCRCRSCGFDNGTDPYLIPVQTLPAAAGKGQGEGAGEIIPLPDSFSAIGEREHEIFSPIRRMIAISTILIPIYRELSEPECGIVLHMAMDRIGEFSFACNLIGGFEAVKAIGIEDKEEKDMKILGNMLMAQYGYHKKKDQDNLNPVVDAMRMKVSGRGSGPGRDDSNDNPLSSDLEIIKFMTNSYLLNNTMDSFPDLISDLLDTLEERELLLFHICNVILTIIRNNKTNPRSSHLLALIQEKLSLLNARLDECLNVIMDGITRLNHHEKDNHWSEVDMMSTEYEDEEDSEEGEEYEDLRSAIRNLRTNSPSSSLRSPLLQKNKNKEKGTGKNKFSNKKLKNLGRRIIFGPFEAMMRLMGCCKDSNKKDAGGSPCILQRFDLSLLEAGGHHDHGGNRNGN